MATPIGQLRERYRFLGKSPIHVVHYGAPDWTPADERPFKDPVALLLVGLAAAHKNMPFMATVLRLLNSDESRRARLTLTATAEQVVDGKTLGEWFAEVTDQVSFLGSVSRSDLPSLYAEHDIVVFPSHYEAFGQPLVEAMAMGVPIVAVDRDWAQEICADAAMYAPLGDARAWADAISTLVRTGDRGNAAGLARAKLFDWDETARAYADLLRR
jgi:glycosyltransferase involved in cell wall biosynthesis